LADTPAFQVTHHRPDGSDADRRIDGLAGPSGNGWYREIDDLILGIENRAFRLWTTTPQIQSVWVEVAQRRGGRKYLKTSADDVEPNNLLALPQC